MWGNLKRALGTAKADPRTGIGTQYLAPGYGSCGRCRTAWKFVKGHSTKYSRTNGMFPLCELCWAEMTPEERLPFYYTLFREWEWDAGRRGDTVGVTWEEIEHAVLAEGSSAIAIEAPLGVETGNTDSTEGKSAGPKGIAQP